MSATNGRHWPTATESNARADRNECAEHFRCPAAADDGRAFFVSVVSGSRRGILAGPYALHTTALAAVRAVEALADKADPWAHAYAYGTCQAPVGTRTIFGKVDPS